MVRCASLWWALSSGKFLRAVVSEVDGDEGSWVMCPPRDAACVARVRHEDLGAWTSRSNFDKTLAQRTYELLYAYDWNDVPREQVRRAMDITEVARQLVCAATFARCDATLPGRAIAAARRWTKEASSKSIALASDVFRACEDEEVAAHPAGSALGICLRAAVGWAETEYMWAVKGYLTSNGMQPEEDLLRLDGQKVPANLDYPAATYPPPLSPQMVCALDGTRWPIFGGEAFGDTTWNDVTNQRTRNLATMSVLELMENGEVFKAVHPSGPSMMVVNIGAFDGVCRTGHTNDPANCLLAMGYNGILVEANKTLGPSIEEQFGHRQPQVRIVLEAALPETISDVLAAALHHHPGFAGARTEVDLIKIDVDGADCELAAALVSKGWRPKIWHVEINPLFPPGLIVRPRNASAVGSTDFASAFTQHMGGETRGTDLSLTGCSVQALLDDLGPEYVLLQVEFENAVAVRRDLADALSPWITAHNDMAKWRSGYFCHPLARIRMPHDQDEDSLFLHYDFRRWGDPALSADGLVSEVKTFLSYYSSLEDYKVHHLHDNQQTSARKAPEPKCQVQSGFEKMPSRSPDQHGLQFGLDDADCKQPWKGRAVSWEGIYLHSARLLDMWARGGGGNLAAFLTVFVEGIAATLNIDHGWTIFKAIARGECPLGGIIVVAVLRWKCGSAWRETGLEFHERSLTAKFLAAMQLQLPMYHPDELVPQPGFGRPAELGCEAVLDHYLETALRSIDFGAAAQSRWPVFEVLSALHSQNHAWPRAYP